MRLAGRELTVRIEGRTLLERVGIEAHGGELLGLIGPNGAGKSTLLRVLAGLQEAESGEVVCDGEPLGRLRPRERARRIAYLPQDGEVHWPLQVETMVALGRLPHRRVWGAHEERDRAAVEKALVAAGVAGLRRRRVSTLSGGERMRALLARALAVEAPVLLADEPVAALDPYHQLAVMELLHEAAGRGTAVVVVLHDLGLAARFCDRLVLLHEGRLLAAGPPEAVLAEDKLRRAYRVTSLRWRHEGRDCIVPWQRCDGDATVGS
ncbi:ABC transporter ATP-binding protein [Geminicoccaceae bacterium 1502E]|nr:ABC transporter ATP-binding protein [Geminicoccaceae bacterium 1502E]